jgi:hypothetical protein
MKTALVISDALFARPKREALRRGRRMSKLLEEGLGVQFRAGKKRRHSPALPTGTR